MLTTCVHHPRFHRSRRCLRRTSPQSHRQRRPRPQAPANAARQLSGTALSRRRDVPGDAGAAASRDSGGFAVRHAPNRLHPQRTEPAHVRRRAETDGSRDRGCEALSLGHSGMRQVVGLSAAGFRSVGLHDEPGTVGPLELAVRAAGPVSRGRSRLAGTMSRRSGIWRRCTT